MRKPGSIVHLKALLRRSIYRLKWRYGMPVDVYRDTHVGIDPKTGKQTVTSNKVHIDRAIRLPSLQHTSRFAISPLVRPDVSIDDRHFIIDGKDIGTITKDNYLIIEGDRYDIKSVENLEEDTGFYLVCKRVTHSSTREVLDNRIRHRLTITSSFTVS